MAALKLIKSGSKLSLRISSSKDATRCHCRPFSQGEMAVLKLNASGERQVFANSDIAYKSAVDAWLTMAKAHNMFASC
eukprot:796220-Karenia_brevis.AAC.1